MLIDPAASTSPCEVFPTWRRAQLEVDRLAREAPLAPCVLRTTGFLRPELAERVTDWFTGKPAAPSDAVRRAARHGRGEVDAPPVPDGLVAGEHVVEHVTQALDAAVTSIRRAMSTAAGSDPVSEDLLHEAAAELEKQAWMFGAVAQLEPRG